MDLEKYMEFFQGRTDVFAEQQADGSYVPIRLSITKEDYEAHIRGEVTLGIYTIKRTGATKLICFDIDTLDPIPRLHIFRVLRQQGLGGQFIVEFSGRKGFHVWLPFENWCPAAVAYQAGRAVLQQANIAKMEVYPKQPTLDSAKEFGNLIKLPLGIHRVSGQKSYFLGDSDWTKVKPLTNDQVAELADLYEEPARPARRPIKVGDMTAYGRRALENECAKVAEAPDGDRNNQLNRSAYALFGLVAGGVLDEDDVAANLHNAASVAGLPVIEVAKTLQSARAAGMARPIGPKED